jgi:hypothetical protein
MPSSDTPRPETLGGLQRREPAVPRIQYAPREDGAVVFRCEACRADILDLRGVYLAYRLDEGWRIECARHEGASFSVDAGRLFGGGLHSVDILAGLACESWFVPAALFRTFLRLRAQAGGLYLRVNASAEG